MRGIKFRAWDTETKEMSYDFLNKNWLKVCIESPYVELMQYTNYYGLEFYDGDIISIACDCDCEYGCTHRDGIYTVVWDEETAAVALKRKLDGRIINLDNYGVENMIVIGNIYENPELLEVSQ